MAITPTSLPRIHDRQPGRLADTDAAFLAINALTAPGGIPSAVNSTAERTLFVTPRGNDSSDGLTLQTAKLTLAAAVATMSDGNGGTIQLGYGSITSAAVSLYAGIVVRGCGIGATTLRVNGVGSAALTLNINCHLLDMRISGNSTASSIGVIVADQAYHWSLTRVQVDAFVTGVKLGSTWTAEFRNVIIQSCTTGLLVTDSGAVPQVNAIHYWGGEIQGCTTAGVSVNNTGGSTKVAFHGTVIESNGYGVYLNSGTLYGWEFDGVYFEANSTGHFYSPGQTRALGIEGCTFVGACAFSVKLDLGIDARIIGNIFNASGSGEPITLGTSTLRPRVGSNWHSVTQPWNTTLAPPSLIRLGAAQQVDVFTSSGTWTQPMGAKRYEVVCIAGGSGGGSGPRRAATLNRCGGGGGGGGAQTRTFFNPADLPSTVTVTIGAGGAGGAAITADNSSGLVGSPGGATTFGPYTTASPGTAGAGGTTVSGTGGNGGPGIAEGGAGGTASTTGGVGGAAVPASGAGGGGSGGGISTADTASNGGTGLYSRSASIATTTGGVVDSTAPSAGTAPTWQAQAGPGAGGGASSVTTAAQAGANAVGYGGGGGGGGAAVNGNNSGAGGAGAPGYCIVITTF